MPINMQEFKHNFATIMALLENANVTMSEIDNAIFDEVEDSDIKAETGIKPTIIKLFKKSRKALPYIASFSIVALGTIAGTAISLQRK